MSDGQFSSKPLRSGPIREVNRSTGEFSEKAVSADAARSFVHSPAAQDAIDNLLREAEQDIGHPRCSPLPRHTPEAARDLGEPLASATLVQEYLIGLVFLRICGWTFMAFGVLFVLAAGVTVIASFVGHGPAQPPIFAAAASALIGIGVAGAGAWFGIFRGRVIMEMCWFCPDGMIWMINGGFDWYRWENIPDVYCHTDAVRPAIGISFRRNISWISFTNSPESRKLVEHIEKRASAACVENVMRLIADGQTVSFGEWRLSRSKMRGPDLDVAWDSVLDLDCGPYDIVVVHRPSGRTVVPLEEVAFPSMFTAVARAIFASAR